MEAPSRMGGLVVGESFVQVGESGVGALAPVGSSVAIKKVSEARTARMDSFWHGDFMAPTSGHSMD
jgi:hypothetical protein